MTSQRVERTWIRTGGYGRFRGEWVNKRILKHGGDKHYPLLKFLVNLVEVRLFLFLYRMWDQWQGCGTKKE